MGFGEKFGRSLRYRTPKANSQTRAEAGRSGGQELARENFADDGLEQR
jgi:hypothetical protein